MHLTPLGDQGVLAAFPAEAAALAFAAAVRAAGWPEIIDIVPAYVSVAVFHDPDRTSLDALSARLRTLAPDPALAPPAGRLHVVPCCYDLGPDLARVADHTRLSPAEVIARHAGQEYTVFAIGFCPGFPYLGYLPPELCGLPRLPSPRLRVAPGSIGLTGRQTGIYPLERPGGWNLVGRTPFTLVDVEAGYFPIRAGDRVRFVPISAAEFESLRGRRLGEFPVPPAAAAVE